jgi:hypothetical protein
MNNTVFVSYSREDEKLVLPVVHLLRAGGAIVFLDTENIPYGEKWESVLLENLRDSERILVFWSSHASKSDWVRREYLSAISDGLKVIPVPLDATPLPVELSAYQALTDLVFLIHAARASRLRAMLVPQVIPVSRIIGSSGTLITLSWLLLGFLSETVGSANVASGSWKIDPDVFTLLLIMMTVGSVALLVLLSNIFWNLRWNRAWREIFFPKPQKELPGLQRAIYEAVFYA